MKCQSAEAHATLKIAASLWSADIAALGASISAVDEYCDSYHFDIMDGHFVRELLFGTDVVASVRAYTKKPFEIHLMVQQPSNFIENFVKVGADVIIFHPEVVESVEETILAIKGYGCKAGVAIVADLNIEQPPSWLSSVDMVLVMGTQIGIKGASLLPATYERITTLRNYLDKINPNAYIQADGGIRENAIEALYLAGADVITAGSLLFNNDYRVIQKLAQSFKR